MLHIVDYIIFIGLLILSLGIGIYNAKSGGKQKTRAEFILNNRQLLVLPTVLSFMVSYQSAISILYAPAEYFQWGAQLWLCLEFTQACCALISERLIVPMMYQLKITSTYEYLELRFKSKSVRKVTSVIGLFSTLIYNGVCVLGPSVAVETITGLPLPWAVVIMAGCCAIYTSLGGMRAVIWTDVVQCGVMIAGLVFMFVVACNHVGGISEVFSIGKESGRLFYANFSFNPHNRATFWSCAMNGCLLSIYLYGFSQPGVQRFGAVKTLNKARLSVLLNVPTNLFYISLCYFVGAGLFAYFAKIQCDPFVAGLIKSPNELMPYFVQKLISNMPGGQGLFLAMIFSASLSTISSSFCGSAANIWEDHLQQFFPNCSERFATLITKSIVLLLAVNVTSLAIFCAYMPGNLYQIVSTLGSCCSGPQIGMFLLAAFFPFVEWRGAIVGSVTGFIITAWLSFGAIYFGSNHQPLAPVGTAGCTHFIDANISLADIRYQSQQQNVTAAPVQLNGIEATEESMELKSVENLYNIGFPLLMPIAVLVTCTTAVLVSTVMCKVFKFERPKVEKEHVVSFKDIFALPWTEKEERSNVTDASEMNDLFKDKTVTV